ncbi:MAG: NAD(P)-binding protein [Myxococcales bacterium]|nr:NAD(P)-binding protein [Myxococcales bacterium]
MRKRIAVLGGGMSSLTTVFELTNQRGWQDRWDITVYSDGYRLGGKGASGRNAAHGQRIEEHGLHILFGFYDNAFRVMRQVYQELGRNPEEPLATFEKAFIGADQITMPEKTGEGWTDWELDAPPNSAVPGVDHDFHEPWKYLEMLLSYSAERALELFGLDPADVVMRRREIADAPNDFRDHVQRAMGTTISGAVSELISTVAEALGRVGQLFGHVTGFKIESALDVALGLARLADPVDLARLDWLITQFDELLWSLPLHDTEARRARLMIDLALAFARGLVVDRILVTGDWFSVDDEELRDWLRRHGAHEDTLRAPIVQGLYDAAFSGYAPASAGASVHALLRLVLAYKGHIYYRMQAGMGDVVFVPFYEVLRRRGVKFELFHQVERLELSADKQSVEKIHIRKQATPKAGGYDPFVVVNGLPSWPSEPIYDRLDDGALVQAAGVDLEDWWNPGYTAGHRVLEKGTDYDLVVLGISIGAFRHIAGELAAANGRFADMIEQVKTTQTRAVQLWFGPTREQLGWQGVPPIVIPFAKPFDTWSDMTHLLPHEDWPVPVGNLAYLCSALPNDEPEPMRGDVGAAGYTARQRDRVKAQAIDWLSTEAGKLWTFATLPSNPDGLNWAWLVDRDDRMGVARFEGQYWRATVNPSERYVLAVPGQARYRLRADESGFGNVYLTGDWTKTAISMGCLEGATMGGIQTARAIDPRVSKALGDWLPDTAPRAPTMPPPPAPRPPIGIPAGALPRYIATDGNPVAIAPVKLEVSTSMFLLDANLAKLQALCDAQLNLGDVTYKALAPFAMVYAATIDNYPLADPIGFVREREIGIWIPVVAGRQLGPLFVPERVVTYSPYVWVDQGIALIGGRTVFGFAKQMGSLVVPDLATGASAESTLDTLVLPAFSPTTQAVNRRLLTIKKGGGGLLDTLEDTWGTGTNLLRTLGDKIEAIVTGTPGSLPVPSVTFVEDMIAALGHGMRMVFLKQFPDAREGTKACYQAIVEADVPISGAVTGGLLAGDFEVDVTRFASHRIVETLGLLPRATSGDTATMDAIAAGWAKFTATIQPGIVTHEAP